MSKPLLFLDMDGVIVDLPLGLGYRWEDVGFWETREKLPWADDLVALCTDKYYVFILSSLGGAAASGTGKMLWLEKHYPQLVPDAILTRQKYLLAAPGRILIDDDPLNCFPFADRGGMSILFPNKERFPDHPTLTVEEIFKWLREPS